MASIPTDQQAPQQRSSTGHPTGTDRSTLSSTPAGRQRLRASRFWHHHPVLFALLVALIGFTAYQRSNPDSPEWYLLLCSACVIGLGLYEVSTPGATKIAEYDRDPNRTYRWMPMPGTPTGVRILGVVMILIGLLAGGTTLAGV